MEHGHHSGMWVPSEPPTWGRLFLPHLDAWSVLPVLALLGLAAYLVGVVRLRRSGVAWRWWRTASWVLGCLSLFAVTGTWLNGYSMVLFSVHMSQHMVLSMVAPLLMLLGCPVTLALRTLPRGRGVAGGRHASDSPAAAESVAPRIGGAMERAGGPLERAARVVYRRWCRRRANVALAGHAPLRGKLRGRPSHRRRVRA